MDGWPWAEFVPQFAVIMQTKNRYRMTHGVRHSDIKNWLIYLFYFLFIIFQLVFVSLHCSADVSSYKSSISTNVIVTSDGNVTWLSMVIFRSSCAVDVKYFPFDEQNCTMLFSSWTYDGFQLNLIKVGDDGDTSNYIRNSEWTLVKLHAVRNVVFYSCCAEPYPDVTYTIQMRRKPLFYVFNMILPCLLITLVALLGFYIPSDSGEKVTMGITTLLSMTVFLMLVAENMPPTSDVLPLVGEYRHEYWCVFEIVWRKHFNRKRNFEISLIQQQLQHPRSRWCHLMCDPHVISMWSPCDHHVSSHVWSTCAITTWS